MRRFLSIALAATLAAGPAAGPAEAAGRVISVGTTGKAAPIAAIPAGLTSGNRSLSLDGVGSLGMTSALPTLAPAALPALNAADDAPAAAARTPDAASNPAASVPGVEQPAPENAAKPTEAVSRPTARVEIAVGEDGANAPTLKEVAENASRLAEASPNGVALIRASDSDPEAAGGLFDGSRAGNSNLADGKRVRPETPAVKAPGRARRWLGAAGRLLAAPVRYAAKARKPAVDTAYTKDKFGGYKPIAAKALPENATRLQKFRALAAAHTGYGLKWAVNLFAIGTILDAVVAPAFAAVPWQLFFSEAALGTVGRVELLTAFGPAQIAQAMTASPVAFLLLALPAAVLMEELTHRVLKFGGWFIGAALARPVASKISGALEEIPDISGLRRVIQWTLRQVEKISAHSYAIAATISAVGFASAHIAMWGFQPYLLFYHAVMGLALAHIAYRSRFVAAPFIAHYLFNAATIALGILAPAALGVQGASIAGTVLGLGSVAFLYYQWRSWRKAKRAAAAEARGETGAPETGVKKRMRWYSRISGLFLIPVLLGSGFMGAGPSVSELTAPMQTQYQRLTGDKAADPAETPQDVQDNAAIEKMLKELIQGAHPVAAPAQAGKDLTTVEIVQRNKPAVVNVLTRKGTGTGFIISPDGTLVTNAHVVSEGIDRASGKISRGHQTQIVIRFADGTRVPAAVLAYSPDKDMAILRIIPQNPFGWPTVTLGDSSTLQEGQEIVAMGYPLGQPYTVTKGIISGLGHRGNGFIQFQQHDAAVNPGNSGGPLFNMRGEVVGINTQIVSPSGAFAGISRSIRAEDLKAALAQFAAQGNISAGWMGAIFYPSNPSADTFGANVEQVRPDSPAAKAGLQDGDVIVGVDGRGLPADSGQAFGLLSAVMRSKSPTDTITLQVDRAGTVMDVVVTLGAR